MSGAKPRAIRPAGRGPARLACLLALLAALISGCSKREAAVGTMPASDIPLPGGGTMPSAELDWRSIDIRAQRAVLYKDYEGSEIAADLGPTALYLVDPDPTRPERLFCVAPTGAYGWIETASITADDYFNLQPGGADARLPTIEKEQDVLGREPRLERRGPFIFLTRPEGRMVMLTDRPGKAGAIHRLDSLWDEDRVLVARGFWEGQDRALYDLRDGSLIAAMVSPPLSTSPGGAAFLCMGSSYVDDGAIEIFEVEGRGLKRACRLDYGIDESCLSAEWREGEQELIVRSKRTDSDSEILRRFLRQSDGTWTLAP